MMYRGKQSLVAFSLCLSVAACAGDDDPAGAGDTGSLTVATYNAGLAVGFVDYAAERAPHTIAAVGGLPVDVVCVQEMWDPEHVDMLQESAAALPNGVFREPDPGTPDESGTAACTEAEVTPLETCVRAACADVGPGELATCALDNCNPQFTATSAGCQQCIAANVGGTLDDIVTACGMAGGGTWAYGGAFGTGILTSATILEQETILVDSTLNRRAFLYAKIQKPGFGEAHVFCTHLSPVFSDIPYPGTAASWEAEQAEQIDGLLAYVQKKTGGEGRIIIAGDLNTGPAVGDIAGEVPDNYARFETAGWANPYTSQASPPCTWCGTNPLVDGGPSTIIDHVLYQGFEMVESAERILDGELSVDASAGPVDTAYSDHYGLSVTLR